MALVEAIDITNWIGKDIDASRQEELVACIAAAQVWIASECGLRSLEKEENAKTEYLDGALLSNNEEAWLPNSVRPAWNSGSDLMTVTEDGTSLTVSTSYSATVGSVIVLGANTLGRVRLYREGGWAKTSRQNIAVACKVGFDPIPTAAVNPIPYDVKRLVMGVAWKIFNAPASVGRSSVSKAGQAVSWLDEMSFTEIRTLDMLRGV